MKTIAATLSVTLCVLAGASPAPQEGQLSLGGTVINSATGEPIQRALVQIVCYARPGAAPGGVAARSLPFVANAFTDSGGSFGFRGLVEGTYTVSAQKPQFSPDEQLPGDRRVQLTASTADVRIRLAPLAAITGKVVDQDGEPVWGASVVAVSVRAVEGLRQTTNERTVTSDERGMFRLWNLRPGRYYLKAAGLARGSIFYVGDSTPQFFGDQGFAPTYHGGGRTLDTATPLAVAGGSETPASLKVQMDPAYAIRGVLENFVIHRQVRLEFLKDGESLPASPVSVNSENGRFEIQSVVSGDYILHATQDAATADLPVHVAEGDLDGVSLALVPGVDLKVHVLISNPVKEPEPASEDEFPRHRGGPFCSVMLYPADGRLNANPFRSENDTNGGYAIHGVTTGQYHAVISCYGGYVQSAMLGMQDLLANPVARITAGPEPPAIEIVARNGGGVITGRLQLGDSETRKDFSVLAVPQFVASAGPVEQSVANAGGEEGGLLFQIANLAPGNYVVYAFAGHELEFRNPRFLQSLTGGVRVQVEDQKEKSVEIAEVIR